MATLQQDYAGEEWKEGGWENTWRGRAPKEALPEEQWARMTTLKNWTGMEEGAPDWLVVLDYSITAILTCNITTLMLGMGAATYWKEIWQHLKSPWGCLLGMICQFGILPAVGFGLCLVFRLPPYQALGVLIVTCSPGGAFSNFFTYWVDGDLALSIIMTALSSLLAFVVMPFNLWAYSKRWTTEEMKVPYLYIVMSLVFVTVPVIFGMVIRHYTRKWAIYISKVCGVLGWLGAITCEVLLILRYWESLAASSLNFVITAALVPIIAVFVAYTLAKMLRFSHKVCRTVAMETGCQNMVVATNIVLLSLRGLQVTSQLPSGGEQIESFNTVMDAQLRGQLVIFPVVYGLWQVAEVAVATGVFQVWAFLHRHDVIVEEVKSVLDTSLLVSIPVPAHKLPQARIEMMADYTGTPDQRLRQQDLTQSSSHDQHGIQDHYGTQNNCSAQEHQCLQHHYGVQRCTRDPYNMQGNDARVSQHIALPARPTGDTWTTLSQRLSLTPSPPRTPPQHRDHLDITCHGSTRQSSTCDLPNSSYSYSSPEFDSDLYPEDILESACNYDSDSPRSPALSNKGVPNMFPVTENDFLSARASPIPYGSPVPSSRERFQDLVAVKTEDKRESCGGLDTPGGRRSTYSSRTLIPESGSPISPSSPSWDRSSGTFGFYHNGVRLGQTQQFSTFARK